VSKKKRGLKLTLNHRQSPARLAGNMFNNVDEIECKANKIIEEEAKRLGFKKKDITPLVEEVFLEFHPDLQLYVHNEKMAGRKTGWTDLMIARLWMDSFDYFMKNPDHSFQSMYDNLAKKPIWKKAKATKYSIKNTYQKRVKPLISSNKTYSSILAEQVIRAGIWDMTDEEVLRGYTPPLKKGL
tara:strand:+ start:173019 stop:173570 length:552 start_codon:yes stop_codon:yes gene_type:complete